MEHGGVVFLRLEKRGVGVEVFGEAIAFLTTVVPLVRCPRGVNRTWHAGEGSFVPWHSDDESLLG